MLDHTCWTNASDFMKIIIL